LHIDSFKCALRNDTAHRLCAIFGLSIVFAVATIAAEPDLPIEDLKGTPPSGQSFREWTDRQRIARWAAQSAPGGEISVVESNVPVRVPFFVITVKDSPTDLVQNKSAIVDRLKERIFGGNDGVSDSLQAYYNRLFNGKLSFFDPADIIPLDLPGTVANYFASTWPRRKLFLDLKEALSHTAVSLEVYNNNQLNGESNDPTNAKDLMDLVVILVLGRSDQHMWPLRSWYEWTGDNGPEIGDLQASTPALPIPDPKNPKKILKLSNYCVMPIFGPAGEEAVLGNGFLAHEMLHAFGLPDLYDRRKVSGGCGGWCCMSWGMYGGMTTAAVTPLRIPWAAAPVWPSAWCRKFLSIDGESLQQSWKASEGDAQLRSPLYSADNALFRIDLPTHQPVAASQRQYERYLLIELRGPGLQKEGTYDWDQQLPGTGFLIWEVNEDVGRQDPLSRSGRNIFWPCVYEGKGQNDVSDDPLVGLWRPSSAALTNLSKDALLQKAHLWSDANQIFKHPDGVVISHFGLNGKVGTFHYRLEPRTVAATTATPMPMPMSTPVAVVEYANAMASVRAEVVGTPDAVSTRLPTEVNERLEHVYAAYPRFEHAISTQGDELKAVTLPAKVNSQKAFSQDVSAHLDLLSGSALGDSRAKIIGSTPVPGKKKARVSLSSLFKGTKSVPKNIGVQLGNKVVRVAGTHVDVQHNLEEEGRVRYFISDPVKLPELPKTVHTTANQAAVAKFLQERFPDTVPKNPSVELVVENGTGRLKWQCRVPTVPTSGPVTIEIDANDPKGLSKETAITIK
jgi:M6 family metalloprotease-like protein